MTGADLADLADLDRAQDLSQDGAQGLAQDLAQDEDAAAAVAAPAPRAGSASGAKSGPRVLPEHLLRVRVEVEIVLGSLRLPLAEVADLRDGAVLALDRKLGDPVDVAVNGRVVARGEVIALDDAPDRLGVVIREMIDAPPPRRAGG